MKAYLSALFLCLSFSLTAHATSFDELNQQIQSFEQSEQARFAPASMQRVKAFQGAALLAYEEQGGFEAQDSSHLDKAISKALQALDEAKNNALSFQNTFPELLNLEKEATKALVYHHKANMLPDEAVQRLYDEAEKHLNTAIINTEKGNLNLAKQAAQQASTFFNKAIDAAMPGLVEQSKRALSHADDVGADKYAPRTFAAAESALEALQHYADDISKAPEQREGIARPEHVGLALETAVYAQKIAIRAKDWKRDHGSFEKLMLDAREQRLNLAKAMHIPLDFEKVDVDISAQDLLNHVRKLQQSLEEERKAHQADMARCDESFENTLAERLREQRLKDQQAFQEKIARIKAAFNSKLERETFEKKRQQKIRDLFQKDEAEIITNLDGSLLIRAKKIKFGSNSSKIDGAYFDFLGRIKEALDLYPSRNIIIEGHTDSSGDAKANRKLSLARAEAVQEFLVAAGLDPNRIKALGYGEARPIASNMYKQGRAMNRRIDIVIQAPQ